MKNKALLIIAFLIVTITKGQIPLKDHYKAIELYNAAVTLFQNGNYDTAVIKLEEAIKLDYSLRNSYLLLNKVLYVLEDTQAQKELLTKAKTIFLEDDELCYYLGKIYQKEENLNLAIQELSEAIKYSKINGEDFPIVYAYYTSRGACYLKLDNYEKAVTDFNDALKFNDSNANIYANKGVALYKLKKTNEACKSWQKALQLGQKSVQTYLNKKCN